MESKHSFLILHVSDNLLQDPSLSLPAKAMLDRQDHTRDLEDVFAALRSLRLFASTAFRSAQES